VFRSTRSRLFVLALAATLVTVAGSLTSVWARAGHAPTIQVSPTATYFDTTSKVAFSVEVGASPDKVVVTYSGSKHQAQRVKYLRRWWETDRISAPKQNCYRITAKATNENGTVERRLRAGRLGSAGC
jgi:hypothetical protein